jgi:hypothetical protein
MAMVMVMVMVMALPRTKQSNHPEMESHSLIGLSRIRRLALIVMTLVLGWFSFGTALGSMPTAKAVNIALTLNPGDPIALSRRSELLLASGALTSRMNKSIADDASKVLRSDPLNVKGLRNLAVVAAGGGQTIQLNRLAGLSLRLSRRDFGIQTILIEAAVAKNDIGSALAQYDIALTVSPAADDLMFPILAVAIQDPEIQSKFRAYVKKDPLWMGRFMAFATEDSKNATTVTDLLLSAGGLAAAPGYRSLERKLLSQLLEQGEFSRFERLFVSLPGADIEMLKTLEVVKTSSDSRFGVAGWQLVNNEKLQSTVETGRRATNPVLKFSLNSDGTWVAARKLLLVKPGTFAIVGEIDYPSAQQGRGPLVNIQVTCAEGRDQFKLPRIQLAVDSNNKFEHLVTIPEKGCMAQYFDFVVSSQNDIIEVESTELIDLNLRTVG